MSEFGPEDERLEAIYDRLEEIDPNTFETRAAELLHGLGFSKVMMARKTKDMSGEEQRPGQGCGWEGGDTSRRPVCMATGRQYSSTWWVGTP